MAEPKADPEIALPRINLSAYAHDTIHWIQVHWLQIAIAVGAGFLIFAGLNAVRRFAAKLRPRAGDHLGWKAIFGRTAARTTQFFIVMASARLVAGYASPPKLLFDTVNFIWIVAAVFQGAIWLREFILAMIERRTEGEEHNSSVENAMGIIRIIVTVALFAIAAVVVLDNLGVNVSGLIAGLGIGGIAIGLAAQGIFSDLFAALAIIFDKPFRRGDTIQYNATTGTVHHIGLKTTRLLAVTGERKIVSNADLLKTEITNLSDLHWRRIKFVLGTIYQTPPEVCAQIPDMLKAIVEEKGGQFVRAGFVNFNASSLDFEVEFDVRDDSWDAIYAIRHAIGIEILRRFNDRGIEFAYPTQTSFTAAPDGRAIMPYPEVQPVKRVDLTDDEKAAASQARRSSDKRKPA